MKILVTGAAGFIGSHVCERLLKQGHEVIGIDNFDTFYSLEIKEQNIQYLNTQSNFKLYRIDIRNVEALYEVFSNNQIQAIIHLAAKAGVRPSILQVHDYMEVNVLGLTNLLELCKTFQVMRFIFASSSSVYGNQRKTPFEETDDVSFPISPYAASKRSGELICYSYHHLHAIKIACMRLFTVYGPRQRPDLAIHKFIELAMRNEQIELYGIGDTMRDYTFVSDIVSGIEAITMQPDLEFEIFNLGNGNPISLVDMVRGLEVALDKKIPIKYIEKQAGDVDQTHASIQKAADYFGYKPQVSFEQGIKQFVDWYRK
ncbi:MAG: GDP-mannose 4,6-dehydratase [Saprospiraceae bacterium]|nr:GDP-mannose 4,6-dehydratase [Saprospiraceae bacterium]